MTIDGFRDCIGLYARYTRLYNMKSRSMGQNTEMAGLRHVLIGLGLELA